MGTIDKIIRNTIPISIPEPVESTDYRDEHETVQNISSLHRLAQLVSGTLVLLLSIRCVLRSTIVLPGILRNSSIAFDLYRLHKRGKEPDVQP